MRQLPVLTNSIRSAVFASCLLCLVPWLPAQVSEIRTLSIGPPDRKALFDMAVTPSGDILSFVARNDGKWDLYRVHDWLSQHPVKDRLSLAGYFSTKDRRDLEGLSSRVFVTADGTYAICVGSAEWLKRKGGWAVGHAKSEDIFSVVNLTTFKVIGRTRTGGLDLYEFHGVEMDAQDRIVVDTLSPGLPRRGAFIQLAVPSLSVGPKCSYDLASDKNHTEHSVPTTVEACGQALRSTSVDDYLRSLTSAPSSPRTFVCKDATAEYCPQPSHFTADLRFALGERTEGHDVLFGGWTETKHTYVLFSISKGAQIGEIGLPVNDSVLPKLTVIAGQDYLLLLRAGAVLTVYELRDSSDVP